MVQVYFLACVSYVKKHSPVILAYALPFLQKNQDFKAVKECQATLLFLTQTIVCRHRKRGRLHVQMVGDPDEDNENNSCYFDTTRNFIRKKNTHQLGFICITDDQVSSMHVLHLLKLARLEWEHRQDKETAHNMMAFLLQLFAQWDEKAGFIRASPYIAFSNIQGLLLANERIEDLLYEAHLLKEFPCRLLRLF